MFYGGTYYAPNLLALVRAWCGRIEQSMARGRHPQPEPSAHLPPTLLPTACPARDRAAAGFLLALGMADPLWRAEACATRREKRSGVGCSACCWTLPLRTSLRLRAL